MKKKTTAQILDTAAAGRISPETDLAPRILAKIRSQKKKIARPGMRLAGALLLGVLAVLAVTSMAYAVYRLISGDPGVQAVQKAGLETTLNVTAQPTLLPTLTPSATPPVPVALGLSQTRAGVMLTLDWVYLDEGELGLGMSFSGLPPGLEPGAPGVTFAGVTPAQARGSTERLDFSAGKAEYVSYQVIHAADVNGKVDLRVDVPLLQENGGQRSTLDTFHFDLTAVPVFSGVGAVSLQQTYAVKVNGVEVRLEALRVSRNSTEADMCYDPAAAGVFSASVQAGGGPETALGASTPLAALPGGACSRLTFLSGASGGQKQLTLRLKDLSAAANPDEKLAGLWEFSADLPDRSAFLGQPAVAVVTAVPLGAQTLKNVSVALDWVFVDARRAAVGYTVRGLPAQPDASGLYGSIQLKNAQGQVLGGNGIGSSTINRVAGQPDSLQGTWSVGFDQPLSDTEASFALDITLDGSQAGETLGYFPSLPQATPYPPGVFPPRLPDQLVGTYHFEFTAPVHPLQMLKAQPPVSANGVELRVARLEITASLAEVMLCYAKPSAGDWWAMSAQLQNAGGDTAGINSGTLVFDANSPLPAKMTRNQTWPIPPEIQAAQNGRCVRLTFLLGHGGRSGPLTLTIPQLELSAPEVIPDDAVHAAQEKLKAQGIEMDYTSMSSGHGGGGSGPRFISLPPGVSQQEAYQRFMEALGYVHAGPWVFTFEINP